MNRRAKLSLASSRNIPKKQAPGFEGMDTASEALRTQAPTPPHPVAVETAVKSESAAAKRPANAGASSTPRSRQFFKVMVVLVATALSLYLLKRRFL